MMIKGDIKEVKYTIKYNSFSEYFESIDMKDINDPLIKIINKTPILSEIKIGKHTYKIKKGDYILYNEACYQFCTGDKRTLKFRNYTSYTSLTLSKTMISKIPFNLMKKEVSKSIVESTKWYF